MNKKKSAVIIVTIIIGLLVIFLISGKENLIGNTVFDMWAALSVSITVKSPNINTDAPTTATEDILYVYDVNISGTSSAVFSVNSSGLFSINSNTGLISFTPRNGQNGSYEVNITAANSQGQDSQNYTLVVSAVNDAPILNPVGDLTGETGAGNTYTATASDEEGDTLTFSIPDKNSSLSMTINSNTGVISVPSGNSAGDYSATIRVSDGTSNDDEDITVHIVTSNSAPTISTEANSISNDYLPSIREDQNATFNITYNDDDGNNTVSVNWWQKNGSLKDFDSVGSGDNFTFIGRVGSTAGTYRIYAEVSDGIAKVNSTFWNLTVTGVKDSDGDGIYDYTDNCKFIANAGQEDGNSNGIGDACDGDLDGDGVDDGDDFLDGDVGKITATGSSGDNIQIAFKIDNSENLNTSITGTKTIALTTNVTDSSTGLIVESPLIEFDHNFASSSKLDLSNFSLKEDTKVVNGESKSVVVVSGISLASGETKTVYLDILLDKNGICVRDEEIFNSHEITNDCSGSSEVEIGCDGSDQNEYSCTKNSTLNKYKITGLQFSGIGEEECTESWSCTSYSTCSGGTQTRTCTDSNNCGTENSKPSESQSCTTTTTGAAVSGSAEAGRGGGEKAALTVDQDLIKVLVKKGSSLRKSVGIKNTGEIELDVLIDLQNLKGVLSSNEYSFKLKPREEKIIDLDVLTGTGVAPGVYVGNILVKAEELLKLIKAVIEIESEKVLFDVSLDIPLDYKTVNPGDEFRVQSTLLNLGGLQNADVLIEYTIKNSNGDIVLKEEETVKVGIQASFIKKFKLPDDIALGEYVISAIVKYEDSVGISSETFNVGNKEEIGGFGVGSVIALIIILIAIAAAIVLERKGLKKIEKKLLKKPEKKSTLKPEEKENLLQELKKLTASHDAGYITKDVFDKSKKKIEELLNK